MSLSLFKFTFMQKFRSPLSFFLYDTWQILPRLCYRSLVLTRTRKDQSHRKCHIGNNYFYITYDFTLHGSSTGFDDLITYYKLLSFIAYTYKIQNILLHKCPDSILGVP